MRILALDLGRRTGWAVRSEKGEIASGVKQHAWDSTTSVGQRYAMFACWLVDCFMLNLYGAIVYELPHHRGGPATRVLVGMAAVLELKAAQAGVECVLGVHTGTLKKHATGKGNTKGKAAMIAKACELAGRTITSEDEADAICLLDYAFSLQGIPTR